MEPCNGMTQAATIQENYEIGIARVQLGLSVKFSCWTVLPWSLCALAHSGEQRNLCAAAAKVRKQWQLGVEQGSRQAGCKS